MVSFAESVRSPSSRSPTSPTGLRVPNLAVPVTSKQFEWEKQLEAADQKQADIARVINEMQAELEKEELSRRKDNQELLAASAQLKQMTEQECGDRSHALQAIERDVAEQWQRVKSQQRQQLEVDKKLSSHFDTWCMEQRATLDEENEAHSKRLDEVEREGRGLRILLEKEAQDRSESVEGVAKDLQKLLADMAATLRSDMAKEVDARKRQVEEHSRSVAEEVHRIELALDREHTERRGMGEQLQKRSGDSKAKVLREVDIRHTALQQLVESAELARKADSDADHQRMDDRLKDLADLNMLRDISRETEHYYLEVKNDLRKVWE